jgi:NAD(P)-dependent dehydrogenase (short-subunit alcohol dehydrogenase family)
VRVLLVGGGCRGLELTRSLTAEGHAVRVVSRSEERRGEIEEAGGECWIGDPDRIGSLRYALANVTVLVWALGTVPVPELHGSRLEMMLERTVDTMVRGVIYETGGAAGGAGAPIIERMCRLNEVPHLLLDADPGDPAGWVAAARIAIDSLLTAQRPTGR